MQNDERRQALLKRAIEGRKESPWVPLPIEDATPPSSLPVDNKPPKKDVLTQGEKFQALLVLIVMGLLVHWVMSFAASWVQTCVDVVFGLLAIGTICAKTDEDHKNDRLTDLAESKKDEGSSSITSMDDYRRSQISTPSPSLRETPFLKGRSYDIDPYATKGASGKRSKPVSMINESRIDAMMVEEIRFNPMLQSLIATKLSIQNYTLSHVADSVWDNGRETDLLVVFSTPEAALLIENKITAPLSYGQAGDYRTRGELGMRRGDWRRFRTCIFAPRRWFERNRGAHSEFDVKMTYEEVADVLDRSGDRSAFKASMLRQAINKCEGRREKDR